MGWHKRFGGRHRGSHGGHRRGYFPTTPGIGQIGTGFSGRAKPILWALALVAVALWSLLAWVVYGLAEPFFGWVAANAGPFASGLGAGGIGGLLEQLSAWLQSIARPAIIIAWAAGAVGLLAAPLILPAIMGLRGRLYR